MAFTPRVLYTSGPKCLRASNISEQNGARTRTGRFVNIQVVMSHEFGLQAAMLFAAKQHDATIL